MSGEVACCGVVWYSTFWYFVSCIVMMSGWVLCRSFFLVPRFEWCISSRVCIVVVLSVCISDEHSIC